MGLAALQSVSRFQQRRATVLHLFRASKGEARLAGRNTIFIHGMHNNASHIGKVTWDLFAAAGSRNFKFTFPANAGEKPEPRFGSEDFVAQARYALAQLFSTHEQSRQPSLLTGHSKGGFQTLKLIEFVTNHPEFEQALGPLIDGAFLINPVVPAGINRAWNFKHAWENWRLLGYLGTMLWSGLFGKMWTLSWSRSRSQTLNDPGRDPEATRKLFESFCFEPGATLWEAGMVWSPSHRLAMRLDFRNKIKVPIFIVGSELDRSNNYRAVRRLADFLKAHHENPDLVHFELSPGDHHFFEGPHEERIASAARDFLAKNLPNRQTVPA